MPRGCSSPTPTSSGSGTTGSTSTSWRRRARSCTARRPRGRGRISVRRGSPGHVRDARRARPDRVPGRPSRPDRRHGRPRRHGRGIAARGDDERRRLRHRRGRRGPHRPPHRDGLPHGEGGRLRRCARPRPGGRRGRRAVQRRRPRQRRGHAGGDAGARLRPERGHDQTSAHDELEGYYPGGYTVAEADDAFDYPGFVPAYIRP